MYATISFGPHQTLCNMLKSLACDCQLLFQHALLSIEQSLLHGRILLIADNSWSTKVAVEIMALSGLSTVIV